MKLWDLLLQLSFTDYYLDDLNAITLLTLSKFFYPHYYIQYKVKSVYHTTCIIKIFENHLYTPIFTKCHWNCRSSSIIIQLINILFDPKQINRGCRLQTITWQ
jgi:hypothetical protein